MRRIVLAGIVIVALATGPRLLGGAEGQELPVSVIPQLGEAAEFYFGPDGRTLIGNARRDGDDTHHVYTVTRDGAAIHKVNGTGRDACSYFFPDGQRIVWTSTRDRLDLPAGDYSDPKNYPQGAELYSSKPDGTDVRRLTNNQVYDAEVSVSPDGAWVLFSRQIGGKLDLWRMRPDGSEPTQITFTDEWQEGGSFYLPDSTTILYRAWKRGDESLRGMPMTIFTVAHDGTNQRQITHDPGTNWAPHPAPDGVHFVYVRVVPPRNFEVFLGDLRTGESRRLTFNEGFDGFPAFSPDGKTVVFSSNRDTQPGDRSLRTYLMDVSSLRLAASRAPGVGAVMLHNLGDAGASSRGRRTRERAPR